MPAPHAADWIKSKLNATIAWWDQLTIVIPSTVRCGAGTSFIQWPNHWDRSVWPLFFSLHFRWNILLFSQDILKWQLLSLSSLFIPESVTIPISFEFEMCSVYYSVWRVACHFPSFFASFYVPNGISHCRQTLHEAMSLQLSIQNNIERHLGWLVGFAVNTMRKHSQSQFDRKINKIWMNPWSCVRRSSTSENKINKMNAKKVTWSHRMGLILSWRVLAHTRSLYRRVVVNLGHDSVHSSSSSLRGRWKDQGGNWFWLLVLLLRNISAIKIEFRCLNCCTHNVVCIPLTSQRSNEVCSFPFDKFCKLFFRCCFCWFLIRRSVYCVWYSSRERKKRPYFTIRCVVLVLVYASELRNVLGLCTNMVATGGGDGVSIVFRRFIPFTIRIHFPKSETHTTATSVLLQMQLIRKTNGELSARVVVATNNNFFCFRFLRSQRIAVVFRFLFRVFCRCARKTVFSQCAELHRIRIRDVCAVSVHSRKSTQRHRK